MGLLVAPAWLRWEEAEADTGGTKGKPSGKKGKGKPEPEPPPAPEKEPEVHWPANLSRLTGLEVEHVPLLEIHTPEGREDIDIVIRVGKQPHEMTIAHFLRWVQIWIDDVKACEMSFEPSNIVPRWQVTIRRKRSIQITVKAHCNLHGIWANRLVL
jgi:desulfoferrodoxin-like iron-binding protein